MSKPSMVLLIMFIVLAQCQDGQRHNLRLVNGQEAQDIGEGDGGVNVTEASLDKEVSIGNDNSPATLETVQDNFQTVQQQQSSQEANTIIQAKPSNQTTQEQKPEKTIGDALWNCTVGPIAGGAVVAGNALSAAAVSAFGFSTGGVVAGSAAAGIQSGIGAVGAGSVFSVFQSLGALGEGILGTAVLPVAVAVGLGASGYCLYNEFNE